MDGIYLYEEETAFGVMKECMLPSLKQVLPKIGYLLLANLFFNLITQTKIIPVFLFHSTSILLGIGLLHLTIPDIKLAGLIGMLISIYIVLYITHSSKLRTEFVIGGICVLFLLWGELFSGNRDHWLQSRGLYMVAVMKMISLAADIEQGTNLPSLIAYMGYVCSPSNIIFGPWLPYKEYLQIQSSPNKKNLKWLSRIFVTVILSLLFLIYSNCWGSYLIPDGRNRWFVAYRQAQSFRSSHYFISYLSEAAMVTAGYSSEKNKNWRYYITNPFDIEVPSSLSSVVVSWNVPMHNFLKKYIYRIFLQYGQFKAILVTYFVSSLLHGFNMEIAAVLLSIGTYSYIQVKFQEKLSRHFNACLGTRPCKVCRHHFTRKDTRVWIAHIIFCLITVFSLLFLGILMDFSDYPYPKTIGEKWEELNYMGHWLMLSLYLLSM